MPYKVGRRKLYRKRKRGYKKKFVPRGLAMKRAQQISTKVFYFKGAGKIAGNPQANIQEDFLTVFWQTQPTAMVVPNIPGDFDQVSDAYQEYKVLAIRLTLYAANVGTGSAVIQAAPNQVLQRGITCIYKDQEVIDPTLQPPPSSVTDVINYGSAKVIPSRVDKWTTTIYRPKGNPEWGNCDRNTPPAQRFADSWRGGIYMLANGCSNQLLWFYTTEYKVVFRGRNYT